MNDENAFPDLEIVQEPTLAEAIKVIAAEARRLTRCQGLPWGTPLEADISEGPSEEDCRLYNEEQRESAEALALLAADLTQTLWSLVLNGTLKSAVAHARFWPCPVSSDSGSAYHYSVIVKHLDPILGTNSGKAVRKNIRVGKSDDSGTAEFLLDILQCWRGLPTEKGIKRFLVILKSQGSSTEQGAIESLKKKTMELPPFSKSSAAVWWDEAALPLLLKLDPSLTPAKQGKKSQGESPTDPTKNKKRVSIKAVFLNLAPNTG